MTVWKTVCVLGLLTLTALAIRMGPADQVFASGRVRLFTDDPPYHARRVAGLLEGDPDVHGIDPFVAHPFGAAACWPWGFDLVLAAVAGPFAGSPPDHAAIARATALAVPFMGALLVPLVFALASSVTDRKTALIAAGFIALLPAHVDYSLVGRVDHHVLESIFVVLAALGPLRLLGPGSKQLSGRILGITLSGAAAGLSFGFVPAALPIASTSVALLGGGLLVRRDRSALWYGASALVGSLVVLPLSPHPFDWVFYSHSLLQVTIIAILLAGLIGGH
ncbi:MAG: hypothetical protein GXP54_08535, partial [Deltaproteobacteria bacterium]|nr:hypothetical protein [Deltaproteobacteria bacterium]